MDGRRDTICDAHPETLQWIFNPRHLLGSIDGTSEPAIDGMPDNVRQSSSEFASWLRTGAGIFWIYGKPGSGKSTLMKQMVDYENYDKLRHHVEACASSQDLVIVSWFFWKLGSRLQRSLCGLYRSLLWQILQDDPLLARKAFPKWQQRSNKAEPLPGMLQSTLTGLVKRQTLNKRYLFLIDGLDEYEPEGDSGVGQNGLAEVMQNLVTGGAIKIIIASRPERAFEGHFSHGPKLALHELTAHDIKLYINARLKRNMAIRPQGEDLSSDESLDLDQVTETIVDRAEGVFLWARTAVDLSIRQIQNGSSIKDLQEEVMRLNSELGKLYTQILERIMELPERDRVEGLRYLKITSHWHETFETEGEKHLLPIALLGYGSQVHNQERAGTLSRTLLPPFTSAFRKANFGARIKSCCFGLLEVSEAKTHLGYVWEVIRPLHRTVLEFLQINANSPAMQNLIHGSDGHYDINIAIMTGLLAVDDYPLTFQDDQNDLAHDVLVFNFLAENSTCRPQTDVLFTFEKLMEARFANLLHGHGDRSEPPSKITRFRRQLRRDPRWTETIFDIHFLKNFGTFDAPHCPDLLAVTIVYGSWRFLKCQIDSCGVSGQTRTPDNDYWSRLLPYALVAVKASDWIPLRLNTNLKGLELLLENGALSNKKFAGTSAWEYALHCMIFHSEMFAEKDHFDFRWYEAIRVLMDRGVDHAACRTLPRMIRYDCHSDSRKRSCVRTIMEFRRYNAYQIAHKLANRTYCPSHSREAVHCECIASFQEMAVMHGVLQLLKSKCVPPTRSITRDEMLEALKLTREPGNLASYEHRDAIHTALSSEAFDPRYEAEIPTKVTGQNTLYWIPVGSSKAHKLLHDPTCDKLGGLVRGGPLTVPGSIAEEHFTVAGWVDLGETWFNT